MPAEEIRELGPLPAGRHGFSREQVAHNQRERLIAGLTQVVSENGYSEVTVADITTVAHVSRRTFYEHFDSKEQCFLVTFDVVIEHLHDLIREATESIPDWPHRVRAGLEALLGFLAAEPQLAHLCMVDSLTAGPALAERYREMILGFAPLLKAGREERSDSPSLPDSTEDTILGSVASVIARSVVLGETADLLEDHLADLTAFTLRPFLGPEEARRIAAETSDP